MLKDDDKKWINELIETRIKDKSAQYTMTQEFHGFLDQCLHAKPDKPSSVSEEEINDALQGLTNQQDQKVQKGDSIR